MQELVFVQPTLHKIRSNSNNTSGLFRQMFVSTTTTETKDAIEFNADLLTNVENVTSLTTQRSIAEQETELLQPKAMQIQPSNDVNIIMTDVRNKEHNEFDEVDKVLCVSNDINNSNINNSNSVKQGNNITVWKVDEVDISDSCHMDTKNLVSVPELNDIIT